VEGSALGIYPVEVDVIFIDFFLVTPVCDLTNILRD